MPAHHRTPSVARTSDDYTRTEHDPEKNIPSFRDSKSEDPLLGEIEERERGRPITQPTTEGLEYEISTSTKLIYLGGYFALNLFLTLYNKALLQGLSFPWTLTVIHASVTSLGCFALMLTGHVKLTKLSFNGNLMLFSFSFLFTLNIAISNVSLNAVSVPFHQIMRSTCPAFAILIQRVCFNRSYSLQTYLSTIPIMAGVALATYGDVYFTQFGFFLTFFGVILASLKTVATNRVMTGSLKLPPLEFLLRMSPLAAIQGVCYAISTGEAQALAKFASEGNLTKPLLVALLGNGFLAFVLNVASFQTNKMAGALTLTVCGNIKQCLTILLGIVLFNVQVGAANGVGMLITIAGAGWYSKVELDVKGKR